jgi:succinate dehydrogenase/fumarate reductase iron-sulfur protein
MTEVGERTDVVVATVRRFAADIDTEPRYETYTVTRSKDMRVLDVLESIRLELGEDIAYEWFCGVKKCGMCGVRVDGEPVLACWAAAKPQMVIEPMAHFQVVRDLVVDRTNFNLTRAMLRPVLSRGEQYDRFPESLDVREMSKAAKFAECIECLLCTSACPEYELHEDEFAGPAALVQLAKVALDPRNGEPRGESAAEGGIGHCKGCGCCTKVCPVEIEVEEDAMEGLRLESARAGFWPGLRAGCEGQCPPPFGATGEIA